MAVSAPPKNRNEFRVAIICALTLEAENVQSMFDRCWDDEGTQYGKATGDQNEYTTGVIGRFNVVLVHMASMGIASAALAAAGLRSSYSGIQLVFIVGICGVAPIHPQTQNEIVLGDIVISTAISQYDFGRQYPAGFQRKTSIDDSLGRASPAIRALLNRLQTRQNRLRMTKNLKRLIQSHEFKESMLSSEYPGADRDWLYEPSYIHQHHSSVDCTVCHNNRETCSKSCCDLECKEEKRILRNRHCCPRTEELAELSEGIPVIHFGRFGSANTVMKSGTDRDKISMEEGLAAFEMEGAGIWEQYPTILLKAACDYADSHKNKQWQSYAAAMAAACLKVLLKEYMTLDQLPNQVTWCVPFDRTSNFIGRVSELARAKQKLFDTNGHRIVSVLGLGGIGKTRLALELAFSFKLEYSVFWIRAMGRLTFEKDMLHVGKQLSVPGIDDEGADAKSLVQQWLNYSAKNHWIMILDNADDEALWGSKSRTNQPISSLVDYLPRITRGSILVTTRTRAVASFLSGKEVISLAGMSSIEAVEMFKSGLEMPDLACNESEIFKLVDQLTYLPLAILQASSFINRTQETITAYLRLLDQTEEDVIEHFQKFDELSSHQSNLRPVATTWWVSFQQIRDHHPQAFAFLSRMACLHGKSIPLSLLPRDKLNHVTEAMAVLVGYSFVKKQQERDRTASAEILYDMHRLVHLCVRSWLDKEGQLGSEIVDCARQLVELFPTADYRHKDLWNLYLPHGERLCASRHLQHTNCQFTLLNNMGLCLFIDGKYHQAVVFHSAALQEAEQNLGATDPQTLSAYSNLGAALSRAGDFSSAQIVLQRAVTEQVKALGQDHPQTLTSMDKLAVTYRQQGHVKQAEELGVQVLEIQKRVLGAEHLSTLISMGNLISTYQEQGRWKQSEELGMQLVGIEKRVLGAQHPKTLNSMQNLASTYRQQGRQEQAEELGVQLIEIEERILGAEHPDTLISMSNLALTYHEQGRWKQAEELDAQVLKIRARVLGAGHPSTLISMGNLASTYYKQGRSKQAEELEVRVLEMRTKVLGPEHPDTLISMNNLACTMMSQKRVDEAIPLITSCKDLCLKVLSPDDHRFRIVVDMMAKCLAMQESATGDRDVSLSE